MKQNLTTLQAGRGVAAIAVLLYHLHVITGQKLGVGYQTGYFSGGDCGVDFFFVLSGFIIFFANHTILGAAREAPRYLYRRVARIYPLVMLLTAIKVGYMLLGGAGYSPEKSNLSNIVCSLLLIPQGKTPVIGPAWTLCYEMFFYSIFLVFILYGPKFRFLLIAHAAACLVLNLPGVPALGFPLEFIFSPYIVEFYLGCVAAYLYLNRCIPSAVAIVACLLGLAAAATGYVLHATFESVLGTLGPLFWGAGFFLVVLGLAVLERGNRIRAPRWLAFTGDASYSIYLLHTSVLELIFVFVARHHGLLGPLTPITFAVATAVALSGGIVLYVVVERPMLNWFYRHGPRKTAAVHALTTRPVAGSIPITQA